MSNLFINSTSTQLTLSLSYHPTTMTFRCDKPWKQACILFLYHWVCTIHTTPMSSLALLGWMMIGYQWPLYLDSLVKWDMQNRDDNISASRKLVSNLLLLSMKNSGTKSWRKEGWSIENYISLFLVSIHYLQPMHTSTHPSAYYASAVHGTLNDTHLDQHIPPHECPNQFVDPDPVVRYNDRKGLAHWCLVQYQ